jgi:endoglucanase
MRTILTLLASLVVLAPHLSAQTVVRINQLGYLPGARKAAVLMSRDTTFHPSSWEVRDALTGEVVFRSAKIRKDLPYGAFANMLGLDFSGLTTSGAYVVSVAEVRSPAFRIAADVYDGTADFLLNYMRQQRCGYNPYLNDSCHARDGYIVYDPGRDSTYIDVVGGWHDASDYLQYVTTSANAVFQMLFAFEMNPTCFGDAFGANGRPGGNGIPDILDEARWGLEWLVKMNPSPRIMFNQIADDRDHMGFKLPNQDSISYGLGRERPVYFCTGKPQGLFQYKNRSTGIASTAGKYASAFALGSILLERFDSSFSRLLREKAIDAYAWGKANPGVCQTAPCRSPYFYEEDNWVDDMELAATQLYRITNDTAYLGEAMQYARVEPVVPWMGADGAQHYQWYPFVNLGHYFLAERAGHDAAKMPLGWLKEGIDRVNERGQREPFRFGVPFVWCSNNFVSAKLTQQRVYTGVTRDSSYADMEASLRDWLFGCNPWGTSMIVGLPSQGTTPHDPHSAFTHVAGFPIDGGLVDGPVRASIFHALRGVQLSKDDPFKEFQSDSVVYHDDWADYSTNEPTMDGTASLTYYLSALQSAGAEQSGRAHLTLDGGAVIRMDSTKKEIYLVFTGHEFADGGESIRSTLRKHGIRASFFFTGDFYRAKRNRNLIRQLAADGHYLGPHSDHHLCMRRGTIAILSWSRNRNFSVTSRRITEQ